jgi:hypothetical protein
MNLSQILIPIAVVAVIWYVVCTILIYEYLR